MGPNLRYHHGLSLDGTGKNTKYFSADSQSPDRYFNPGPSEHEAGAVMLKWIVERTG
jgi:hypothetical protein